MNSDFKGTFTALATPFDEANNINYLDFESLINHQINGGINGLVITGTTGESPTLSHSEHIEVIDNAVNIVKNRVPVFAGTGSNSTHEAIELSKKADAIGVDGLLVVAPYYNKPSEEGLFNHFSEIAKVTDLPIILYSIPSRCGIEISIDVTARLYEKYPNICCMKAAEGSCDKVAKYVQKLGSEFCVLSGDDSLTLPFMACGAKGVISVASNLFVSPIVEMVNLANMNDYDSAQKIFLKYYDFFNAIFLEPNPVPIKYCLNKYNIINSSNVRLPLVSLKNETKKNLDGILKKFKESE